MDDGLEADENETVKGCMLTLRSITLNHPEECLEFIIPQIKQNLSENDPSGSSTAMKRGLRRIAAKFLPDSDIEDICLSIIELLNTPMRKEAISTLEKIALAHQNFYPQSLNSIFSFICYSEEDDAENSSLRMQEQ
ncbi:hypothetical protein M9Y10_028541 [Tritrichomonas musculus]|uniref:Uncharacterized protein n=1 Tax=Tritrichomonas musculus TaxID=1915356 RepID=A0ABR2KKM6_9EUKA